MEMKLKPSFTQAISLIIICFLIIFTSILTFNISVQVALLVCMFLAILLGKHLNFTYNELEGAAADSVRSGLQALFILVIVGAMVGTWIAGGVVPSMIYYGLKIISPKIFLLAALLICSLTSLATGTSWGTVGTTGVAMMGIGVGLGVPAPITAGAVLSGAYFGDKMSPLSDSTNLTASMSETNVFSHIMSMMYTTIPSYIIVCIMYLVVGFKYGGNALDASKITEILTVLETHFDIGILMVIPAIIVIALMIMKKPAFPSIAIGAALGSIWAILFQGKSFSEAVGVAWGGYAIDTHIVYIDKLLNRGGMTSMLSVVAVMLFGLGFGGVLKHIGVLDALIEPIAKKIKSVGQLILSTIVVGNITNAAGCSMYISLIMTPQLMRNTYKRFNLKPEVLSRATEDGGTLTAPLFPWTDNALYMCGVLGVSTFSYVPWAFFLWLTPLISILLGYINKWGILYKETSH
ncbi:MAG: Na+/H+ antiporter NhaC [Desulfobacterales bacterium]|nr:Na+/H+ antiporter NhaC [Desulfobacterales bacterium]